MGRFGKSPGGGVGSLRSPGTVGLSQKPPGFVQSHTGSRALGGFRCSQQFWNLRERVWFLWGPCMMGVWLASQSCGRPGGDQMSTVGSWKQGRGSVWDVARGLTGGAGAGNGPGGKGGQG